MKLFAMTSGDVLELGCGHYSTIFLHWACYLTGRKLVTLESKQEWFNWLRDFKTDWHEVRLVDWTKEDLKGDWSIAFVDHEAGEGRTRGMEVVKLANVDYVICHDSENASNFKYRYSQANPVFAYRWKYTKAGSPYTTVFSNKHDVKDIC